MRYATYRPVRRAFAGDSQTPLHAVRCAGVSRDRLELLEQPIATAEFLVVDTETNGLGGDACELTEVGAVLVGGGELHDRWSSLVRTRVPLRRGIQRFTGITQEMVDDAPAPRGGAAAARASACAAA